ncbi:MAG TPA: MFS transporter, partial [Bryobacteraceae bacterium]|nr:MFS transporter [Bryobacteraceae bacterium]
MFTPRRLRRAWITSAVIFLIHGLVVSQWAARIPAIQAKLNIGAGAFGTALMAAAVGSICSIPLCGWLVTKFGSARITLLGGVGFCAALIPLALATNATLLAAALFLYGGTAGTMDVAMNVQAVEVERAMGTRVMSRFHAVFSVGGMAGAAFGGLVAARGVRAEIHLLTAACVLTVLLAVSTSGMIPDHQSGDPAEPGHFSLRVPPALLAISAIAFCILASEGAVVDWSALFLGRTLKADPGTAALGFSVFSGAMATVRFMGDWISHRVGSAKTV